MKVIWTPEAKETFDSNINYLLTEWNDKIALDFMNRVEEVVLRIKANPDLFPTIHKSERVHRCIVVKQISLYYRIVSSSQIDLLTFWNNFRDPEKLKL